MPLEWLPTEVLAGVLTRVGPNTRWQAELVDGRLAAVARTHAWRHTHRLDIENGTRPRFGGGRVVVALASVAAVRAVIERARITHLRFVGYRRLKHSQKTQLKTILAALAEAPRVRLLSLKISGIHSPYDFDNPSAELAKLVECHSTTLVAVALHFPDMHEAMAANHALYAAVGACAGLRHLAAGLHCNFSREQLAVVLSGKRLRTLRLFAAYFPFDPELDTQVFLNMPSAPSLEELQLFGIDLDLACLLATKPAVLAKLQRFKVGRCNLGGRPLLLPVLRCCPALRLLDVMIHERHGIHSEEFGDEASLKALPRAYFAMPDAEHTLFACLPTVRATALVATWQADVAGLHVDCYDEAIRAAAGLPAPVDEPPPEIRLNKWEYVPAQLSLRLDGGKRRLVIGLEVSDISD